jgi:hypothetical protein
MLTVIRILSQDHHPHVPRSQAFEGGKKTVKSRVVHMTPHKFVG